MRKALLWTLLGGMVYYAIEGLWRIPQGGLANVAMLPVGGLCFAAVGGINQIPAFYNLSMRLQSLIGAAIVLLTEYAAGWLFNIRMGMSIWDYSHLPLNLHGQVCLLFAIIWFCAMPFAIWLEDRIALLRVLYLKFRGRSVSGIKIYDYTLGQAYKEWAFGKEAAG